MYGVYVTNQDLRGDWFEGSVLMQSLACLRACLYNTKRFVPECTKQSARAKTILRMDDDVMMTS